ncbi:MAG: CAP domain-containing protein [Ekhidna sp.]
MSFSKRVVRQLLLLVCFLAGLKANSQLEKLDPLDYFSQFEINEANTADGLDYLTKEEKNIYLYTNLVRLYPKKFYILYKDFVIAEGKESLLKSNSYYTTLTENLKNREVMARVFPNEQMFKSAECWAIESGSKGLTGHDRKDCAKEYDGENCAYGLPTGISIVMQLLIDYGVPDLGHRKNIFHPDWVGMGAAIRPHSGFRVGAVQNFSRTNDLLKEEAWKRHQLVQKRIEDFESMMNDWNKNEVVKADVNRNAKHLNEVEKDFYLYINLMRINPKKFKAMIWDEGPFFDQLPNELDNGIRKEDQYKEVGDWLQDASNQEVLIPGKKRIAELRCIIQRFRANNSSYNSCIKSGGAWSFATYYSESNFNDAMNILLTPKEFEKIANENVTVALEGGEPAIKVIFVENYDR